MEEEVGKVCVLISAEKANKTPFTRQSLLRIFHEIFHARGTKTMVGETPFIVARDLAEIGTLLIYGALATFIILRCPLKRSMSPTSRLLAATVRQSSSCVTTS